MNIQLKCGTVWGMPSNVFFTDCTFKVKKTGEVVNGRKGIIKNNGYIDLYRFLKVGDTFEECKSFLPCEVEEVTV